MIFFGHVTPPASLKLDHLELYGDLLKGRLANCRVQIDIDRKKTPRPQQLGVSVGCRLRMDYSRR